MMHAVTFVPLYMYVCTYMQAITLSVSGDMTAQDLLVKVHQQLRLKVPSIDPLSRYTLHMVPKEFENKKFLPSASTSECLLYILCSLSLHATVEYARSCLFCLSKPS